MIITHLAATIKRNTLDFARTRVASVDFLIDVACTNGYSTHMSESAISITQHQTLRLLAVCFCFFPQFISAEITKQDCLKASQNVQQLNLSAGVYTEKAQVATPLHIKLPPTVDDRAYFACLIKNQLIDQNSAERYLARQDECRTKTRLLAASSDAGKTRIGKSDNDASYVACMDSVIGVDVLESPH